MCGGGEKLNQKEGGKASQSTSPLHSIPAKRLKQCEVMQTRKALVDVTGGHLGGIGSQSSGGEELELGQTACRHPFHDLAYLCII
jgi:hypothetical protein